MYICLLTGIHSSLTGPIHMADEEGPIREGRQFIIFTASCIIFPYSSSNPTGLLGLQKCSTLRRHCDRDQEEYDKTIVNYYYRIIIILSNYDMSIQIPSSGASIGCFSSRNGARRSTGDISFLALFWFTIGRVYSLFSFSFANGPCLLESCTQT